MHKGYAFVQFTSPFDARSACLGEDGRSISGQVIDVNMVSEPKPNHGQQKTNASSSGNKGIGQKRAHGDAGNGEDGENVGQACFICFLPYHLFFNAFSKYLGLGVLIYLYVISGSSDRHRRKLQSWW